MLEGPLQSNRTPPNAERAIFGILKSCRNREYLFLQSKGLWLNCGYFEILIESGQIDFNCINILPPHDAATTIVEIAMPSRQMWWWLSSLQVCMSSRHKWKCNLPILLQCNKSRHNPRGLCHDNCNLVRLAWIESGLWAVNGIAVKLWYAVQSCPQSFELWWHSDKRDGDCRHLKKKAKSGRPLGPAPANAQTTCRFCCNATNQRHNYHQMCDDCGKFAILL